MKIQWNVFWTSSFCLNVSKATVCSFHLEIFSSIIVKPHWVESNYATNSNYITYVKHGIQKILICLILFYLTFSILSFKSRKHLIWNLFGMPRSSWEDTFTSNLFRRKKVFDQQYSFWFRWKNWYLHVVTLNC